MNLKKEITYLVFEIIICLLVIVFGYHIWNNFNLSNYEIAKSYADTREVIVALEDTNNIVISNDENSIEDNILYLHNISGKENYTKLVLKLNKENELFKNNTIIKIDSKYYILSELDYIMDDSYVYITIDKYHFNEYETKELKFKLLSKDSKIDITSEQFNYEFITQL